MEFRGLRERPKERDDVVKAAVDIGAKELTETYSQEFGFSQNRFKYSPS